MRVLHRPLSLGVLLESATDPLPPHGCRLWTLQTDRHGYGRVKHGGRAVGVHRLVLAMSLGARLEDLPTSLDCRHLCPEHQPRCVEPSHLALGTRGQNILDAVAANRHNNARKTHCRNGHEFDESNTYLHLDPATGRAKRFCRTCNREAWHRRKL